MVIQIHPEVLIIHLAFAAGGPKCRVLRQRRSRSRSRSGWGWRLRRARTHCTGRWSCRLLVYCRLGRSSISCKIVEAIGCTRSSTCFTRLRCPLLEHSYIPLLVIHCSLGFIR
uniref:Uncharacterized protein n=1 Tax=Arundo donax TaxID=35708 RepID=A0A0A9G1A2_ARUDO